MSVLSRRRASRDLVSMALLLASCSREPPVSEQQAPIITNRLATSPEVVANIGITFAPATRGRLGVWLTVPGQLEVPETHRWTIRAPARGRLTKLSGRWQTVKAGDIVAELSSAGLPELIQELLAAENSLRRSGDEAKAAAERLAEAEALVVSAHAFARALRQRLDELRDAARDANALAAKELLDAQRALQEAERSALDVAVARDDLRSRTAEKELRVGQAKLALQEHLSALSLLVGQPVEQLTATVDGQQAWRSLEKVAVRAPADGILAEVLSARGDAVDQGALLAALIDTSVLRFRGRLPEGDLSRLRAGAQVRVEVASEDVTPITSELLWPIPIADEKTRTLQIEAAVANPEHTLPHGISATAHVLIRQGEHEEVLIPEDCVVLDGLEAIVFRRDPKDTRFVIRTPVELGVRNAGQVEVLAGVQEGDFVVQKGVHQLKHTGLGKAPAGGHFHADGTWHEGDK